MSDSAAQFHHDELASWSRSVKFLSEESDAFIRRIAVVMSKGGSKKQTNQLNDQINSMLNAANIFDELRMFIFSQQQRLNRFDTSADTPDDNFIKLQNRLRRKIRALEQEFSATKYIGSTFLFDYLRLKT